MLGTWASSHASLSRGGLSSRPAVTTCAAPGILFAHTLRNLRFLARVPPMASSASYDIAVKGDPNSSTLGDCKLERLPSIMPLPQKKMA